MDNRNPLTVTNSFWLYALRKEGVYPDDTENSGKWLIFVPSSQVNTIWDRIKSSTEAGQLGSSSKVATMKQNPNATEASTKVICVYTYDWTDRKDVMRIRQELRILGITSRIPYKANVDTYIGKYAKQGEKRISKYYE